MRGIVLFVAAMLIVISAFWAETTSASPSAPVRVTFIQAGCNANGKVSGLITVQNVTNNKVTYEVPLVLTQHVPPSREGEPKFSPVLGANTVVLVSLAGGATLGFSYEPLDTSAADSRANSQRVEVDVGADSTLNWGKSESFPPCGISTPTPEPTPTPGPTSVPTSEPTPEPTVTPVASSTQRPPEEMPSALPVTGDAPLREHRSVNWLLGLAIVIPLIMGGAWSMHRSRQ